MGLVGWEDAAKMVEFELNGKRVKVDASLEKPLLYVLREDLGLTGTKYGCGIGRCGSCTVHINSLAQQSCQVPLGDVQDKRVTTIEGLAEDHPVKRAWVAEQVPQCGYCQPGQIMRAAALLAVSPHPSRADMDQAMSEVLCRCGSYPRIKKAIQTASELLAGPGGKS